MGRLTLNPIAHINLIGTILLPALLIISNAPFLFGYAKPVPVNFQNLNNPKRDMVWVALAGPAMNLLLALGCVLVLKFGLPLIAVEIHSSA
jgi:Zn-dependent protease